LFIIVLGMYYVLVALFSFIKKPEGKTIIKKMHKFALIVAAHNEEKVIAGIVDSLQNLQYDKENYDVYVIADNCTDDTAAVAREKGAVCYERFDDVHRTKGYALQFLFENIKNDYGIESFEGYFIFDADNLLNKNYISKMQKMWKN